MAVSKRIVLHFPRRLVDRPIVSRLVRDFNLDFNILKASVTPDEEGLLVLELPGDSEEEDGHEPRDHDGFQAESSCLLIG